MFATNIVLLAFNIVLLASHTHLGKGQRVLTGVGNSSLSLTYHLGRENPIHVSSFFSLPHTPIYGKWWGNPTRVSLQPLTPICGRGGVRLVLTIYGLWCNHQTPSSSESLSCVLSRVPPGDTVCSEFKGRPHTITT